VKPSHINALKNLALLGAIKSRVPITSGDFGKIIGLSQQSASRLLRELKEEGTIDISRGRKTWVMITEKGSEILMKEYSDYKAIFGEEMPVIKGRVESGMGEGRYYLSKEGYVSQIKGTFDFDPYPGTLNIRLSPEDLAKYRTYLGKATVIKGFVSEGRTFGDVLGIKGKIEGIECALISPKRTHYSDVVEIIAPVKLREALSLKDGDCVTVLLDI